MKFSLSTKLFVGAICVCLAGWLWLTDKTYIALHAEESEINKLDSIIQLDHKIRVQLAFAEVGRSPNYDDLTATVREIDQILASFDEAPPGDIIFNNADLKQQITTLQSIFSEKKQLIENLKSDISITKNSMALLPMLVFESLMTLPNNQPSSVHLNQTHKQLMQLVSSPSYADINNWHKATRQLTAVLQQANNLEQYQLINKHLDMAYQSKIRVNDNLHQVRELGFLSQIEGSHRNYIESFKQFRSNAERTRLSLQLAAVGLLLCTLFSLFRLLKQGARLRRDNQSRKDANETLKNLAILNHQSLDTFFNSCVENLSKTINADIVALSFFDDEKKETLTTKAMFMDGEIGKNFSYPIKGTPCDDAVNNQFCIIQNNVAKLYPEDTFLKNWSLESYCGMAIFDRHDEPIGILAILNRKPLKIDEQTTSLLRVFTSRVSIELERDSNIKNLNRERSQAIQTLNAITDGVIATDAKGNITSINPAAVKMLEIDDVTTFLNSPAKKLVQLVEDSHPGIPSDPLGYCLDTRDTLHFKGHSKLLTTKNTELAADLAAAPIFDTEQAVSGAIMVLHDADQERKFQTELAYQASHDGLTGLLNRRALEEKFQNLLESIDANKSHSLLFIDLDRFKVVNDSCGHAAGDELLCKIAELLSKQVRETDTLARLGGDEFFVLLTHCPLQKAQLIAEKIREQLEFFRFFWENKEFNISASIGLVHVDTNQYSFSDLISMVDVACLSAKNSGRNKVVISELSDSEFSRNKGEALWIPRLEHAIEHNMFQLYQQVIVPVNHAIVSRSPESHYEILLRLRDEDGELVMPYQFIPPAERYDLMGKVDRWVIHHVITRMCGEVPGTLLEHAGQVSINLSGQSLADETLLPFIQAKIKRYKLDPKRLCFEVTETNAIGNYDTAIKLMNELHNDGCRFALDDFGSGLTSYSYIKNLPADYVKIDRQFTRDLASDTVNRAIVNSVIEVAKSIRMLSIAEGVEDAETQAILDVLGIDYVQGYGLGYPEPVDSDVTESPVAINN